MKYISAYLLSKLGGKENPSVEDIKEIIESVGIEFEQRKAEEIINKMNGKDVNEVIEEGKTKMNVVSNNQSLKQEQTSKEQKEEDQHKEEEEAVELGVGFDDLFG